MDNTKLEGDLVSNFYIPMLSCLSSKSGMLTLGNNWTYFKYGDFVARCAENNEAGPLRDIRFQEMLPPMVSASCSRVMI